MSKNTRGIPFIEIEERVAELARDEAQNSRPKIRGIIQNLYTNEIPRKYDWTFLLSTTSLLLNGQYKTGTVSGTTGGSVLTFSGATITASMTGRRAKLGNNDFVYGFTYTDSTGGTVDPQLYGTTNPSGTAFNLYDPDYSMPENFDRFPKGGGLIYYTGGRKTPLPEEPIQEYFEEYSSSPSTPQACRLVGIDTMGNRMVEIRPAPKDDMSVGCTYLRQLRPLRSTSAGVLDIITAKGMAVTGSAGVTRFTEATTGDYLRVDALGIGADSEWYRIQTITNDSSLTLSTAFANTSVTSAGYVICSMPEYPDKLQDALIWGTLRTLVGDSGDPMFQFYNLQLAEVLSDGKRLYVNRVPNQEIDTIATEYGYRR